jgi:hypothetical protein
MGCGASAGPADRSRTIRQYPAVNPLRFPDERQPSPEIPQQIPQRMPQRTPHRETVWPLPPEEKTEAFQTDWPSDLHRYSLEAALESKVQRSRIYRPHLLFPSQATITAPGQPPTVTKTNLSDQQSSTFNAKNTSNEGSAHVQSELTGKMQSSINLKTSEEIPKLLLKLNQIHSHTDQAIEQRVKKITAAAKDKTDVIMKEVSHEQQRLIAHGNRRQARIDTLYHEWLQLYIVALNEWKARELIDLEKELNHYREKIDDTSQALITRVNNDSSKYKASIVQSEQLTAHKKIEESLERIKSLSAAERLQVINGTGEVAMNMNVNSRFGQSRSS